MCRNALATHPSRPGPPVEETPLQPLTSPLLLPDLEAKVFGFPFFLHLFLSSKAARTPAQFLEAFERSFSSQRAPDFCFLVSLAELLPSSTFDRERFAGGPVLRGSGAPASCRESWRRSPR